MDSKTEIDNIGIDNIGIDNIGLPNFRKDNERLNEKLKREPITLEWQKKIDEQEAIKKQRAKENFIT